MKRPDDAALKTPSDEALSHYRARRNFALTPEPAGAAEAGTEALYVVQKHWASHLHYDFRIELGGVMKSWAVPKGPSLDPKDKRMAVQVEDHPLAYAGFEGTIPPKQYGAGQVIVWDRGTWRPLGDAEQGLRDGNLKFELQGHKLHGKWVLVRMKGKGEKQVPWLLIKEKDAFARASADFSVVDEQPDSVQVLADSARASSRAPSRTPASAASDTPVEALHAAPSAALPARLAPALATLLAAAPHDPQAWRYEIKFDGYRLLARIDAAGIQLLTRNGHDWTQRLLPLHAELASMQLPPGWYDGEIVVPNEAGVPDFGALQRAFETGRTDSIVYYLFDLPFFDGRDLRGLPLATRRETLKRALKGAPGDASKPSVKGSAKGSAKGVSSGVSKGLPKPLLASSVRFSEGFDGAAESVLASACKLGLEGVIGKRSGSTYRSGRTSDWIKLKCGQRQEFVIGGYTEPQAGRAGFGALLLGVHGVQPKLDFAGRVGTGFSQQALGALRKKLDAIGAAASPFNAAAEVEGRPHWVEPTLVAEVSFGEWTQGGRLRHAVFHGLRSDKAAAEVVREKAVREKAVREKAVLEKAVPEKAVRATAAQAPRPVARAIKSVPALPPGLRVTHPERVIDSSTGITKIELLRHYAVVGDLMMAHLKGRPVALVRAPVGVGGELFFQKHADTATLPGIRALDPALWISHPPMLEVASKLGLLSAAQWNVVEFHTLNTGTASFEHPDRMVFDLDPGDRVAWPQVREAAQLVQAFLLQLGLAAFLKTSGGKGLHIVVPVRKLHDWDTVKGFSQAVVAHMAATIPQRFVARSGPKNRVGKIFIDYLRNGLGATTVCAWSARARPGLGVSVPVDWSELDALTAGDHWTVRTLHTRLATGNDPWRTYARSARGLTAAMKTLGYRASGS